LVTPTAAATQELFFKKKKNMMFSPKNFANAKVNLHQRTCWQNHQQYRAASTQPLHTLASLVGMTQIGSFLFVHVTQGGQGKYSSDCHCRCCCRQSFCLNLYDKLQQCKFSFNEPYLFPRMPMHWKEKNQKCNILKVVNVMS